MGGGAWSCGGKVVSLNYLGRYASISRVWTHSWASRTIYVASWLP